MQQENKDGNKQLIKIDESIYDETMKKDDLPAGRPPNKIKKECENILLYFSLKHLICIQKVSKVRCVLNVWVAFSF